MACTYTLIENDCLLEIQEDNGTVIKQIRTLNGATLRWRTYGSNQIGLSDGDGEGYAITLNINNIPAFATIALLTASLETFRDGCAAPTSGGITALENCVCPGSTSAGAPAVASTLVAVTVPANTSRKELIITAETPSPSQAILYVKEGPGVVAGPGALGDWTYALFDYDSAIIEPYDGIVTYVWDAANVGDFAHVTEISV